MITRKRINNDIFIRWAIFKPDITPEDFSNATIQYVRAEAVGDGSIYDLTYKIDGHILDIQFPANKQKDIGLHNLILEYTKPDATVEGGVATYTIDYCNAFDLVPVTCALLSPQKDPIVIQGIIAAFSYSMLTNEEKNDLANRLSLGSPYLRLRTNTYIIHEDNEGNHSPNVVEVYADTTNTNVSEWKVGINGGVLQVVEEGNSPFAEVVLENGGIKNGVIKISTSGIVRDRYEVRATDGVRVDSLVINKLTDGENGMGNQMIYKRTTTEVAPTGLTNSQDDNHLPTGWTRKPTGVTNNWKYEWVSVRHKVEGTWDNFSTPPALFAKYSENGAPGQQGLDGPVVRVTEWQTGQNYENQEDLITHQTRWIDVVIVRRSDGDFDVYKCIASHTSSAVNKPGSGGSWTVYWEAFQTMPPIYTPMIMADNAIITFNQSNQLVVTNAAGVVQAGITGGEDGNILIWSGGETPAEATFKVYRDGTIEGTGFQLNANGSGFIANQNISWKPDGSATYKGALVSNASGDKIIIDTTSGAGIFKGIDSAGNLMIQLGFDNVGDSIWKNSAVMRLFSRGHNPADLFEMKYSYGSINMSVGVTNNFSRAIYGIQSFGIDRYVSGSRVAQFSVSPYGPFTNPNMLSFELTGLPTSASGLPTGTVWRDSNGFLRIV